MWFEPFKYQAADDENKQGQSPEIKALPRVAPKGMKVDTQAGGLTITTAKVILIYLF